MFQINVINPILIAFNNITCKRTDCNNLYHSPPVYAVVVPESISSDKISGAVGSEAVTEFEFTGEPCNCIIYHNLKNVINPSYIRTR